MTSQPPRIVEKPWGREIIFAAADRFAGKILEIDAGRRLSLHYHERRDEAFYVQRGRVRIRVGPSREALRTVELGPGDAFHLPAGTLHRLETLEDTVLLEASSPELDDIVRLEDDYGRTGSTEP